MYSLPFVAQAVKQPTREPLLRIETGMHTTLIRRLLVDEPRRRLFTCSDDKTIRVWQMPETRLMSIIRIPIDHGHEGQLFALAISPDGKTLAAAGWTGWDWEGEGSIYFFEVASGKLLSRQNGFKNAFSAMSWMPDGKHLAIGLQGATGFQILRIADNKIVANDTQYLDKVIDIHVNPAGKIAVVSFDGMIRLYDENFKLLGRRKVRGGKQFSSVRFSSSGDLLAVGFLDNPTVSILNASDLSYAYTPKMDSLSGQVNFATVAWSSKGDYLYAAGDYKGTEKTPIYRWNKLGKGNVERIPLVENRINEIQRMSDGFMAFAAEDPGLGVINEQAEIVTYKGPDIINYRNIAQAFAVSDDGSTVTYRFKQNQPQQHVFSVTAPGDQDLSSISNLHFNPAQHHSSVIKVNNWQDSLEVTINGNTPLLDDYEISRSYAITADNQKVLLGTEWGLRLYDINAKAVWSLSLPAVAWGVTISANNHYALAALSDGTIRWYRMLDGKEVLAYFPHNNGKDWIAWIPEGYYSSSIYGDHFVGWHLNRGKDIAPDFFKAVQFDRFLYRPDIVKASFKNALNDSKRNQILKGMKADFMLSQLSKMAPPRLTIQNLELDLDTEPPRLTLQIEGEKTGLAIQDYILFVNNIPVTPSANRVLSQEESHYFKKQLNVELRSHKNNIRVEAFNGVSMGVAETFVSLPESVGISESKGNLYLLSIGADVFPKLPESTYLEYASEDSDDIAKIVNQKSAACFNEVHTKVLSDNVALLPERKKIIEALDFLNHAEPNDTVAIFLASHGISDPAGNYYFVPRDSERDDLTKVANGEKAESLISWKVFFNTLRNATGRRLLIVDTCQAQNIEGKFEAHSLLKRSASSLFSLIVASKGDEYSQEYSLGKHGLFTYSLINSLNARSDKNKDGKVSLIELFDSSSKLVDQLREKSVGPQTPQIIAPEPLGEMSLLCE